LSHYQNIARIKAVHRAFQELASKILFVGGATVSLYTDRPFGEIRPTDDVDVLIELIDYTGYAGVEDALRRKGFVNDVDSGIICRFKVQGITVDIMPTNQEVLGFTNRWYSEGFKNSKRVELDQDCVIQIFQPVYFIASKLEAFKGRGNGDGRMSSDFEDIVFILNNRTTIWDEMKNASASVRDYLIAEFKNLNESNYLFEWVSVHLDYSEQRRVSHIMGEIEQFVYL
jgi:predicted nucleotidyltransferase